MTDASLASSHESAAGSSHGVSLAEATRVWARVACLSFGGPAGQIAVMHRILVDEKKWISDARFLHALNYCMLLPGPEAQQLATYIGWLMHRTAGGLIAGGLFILPGIVSIMALSWIYATLGNVPFVAGLFFGLKAAVIAVVFQALARVAKRALKTTAARVCAALSFVALFFLGVPFPLVIVAAALTGAMATLGGVALFASAGHGGEGVETPSLLGESIPPHARPDHRRSLRVTAVWLVLWLAPVAAIVALSGQSDVFAQIAVFFSKMAVVTFGGAYAVLTYVAQQAVQTFHWLSPGEMLDGLGMAETTPGPLIMVLQFVGFMAAFHASGSLLAATFGGLLATWVTFAPCFLWILAGAPYIEALRGNRILSGALAAISASVVGVILNLAVWFSIHTLFRATVPVRFGPLSFDMPVLTSLDPVATVLAIGAALAIMRFKVDVGPVLAGCALFAAGLRVTGVI